MNDIGGIDFLAVTAKRHAVRCREDGHNVRLHLLVPLMSAHIVQFNTCVLKFLIRDDHVSVFYFVFLL